MPMPVWAPSWTIHDCSQRPFNHLLDHLIRLDEERRGDGEAERLGGLEIDDQQKFGRRLYRQVRGRRTPQDAIDIRRCPPETRRRDQRRTRAIRRRWLGNDTPRWPAR